VACLADQPARRDDGTTQRSAPSCSPIEERSEHALVLGMIPRALALCDGVRAPSEPYLMHAERPAPPHAVEAAARRCRRVDLVARLHPTPAVGGVPTAAALDAIRAHSC
jgi:isochorismate synthase EntC